MIRHATDADLPAIVAMGRRFLAETAYQGRIGENPQQMETLAATLINRDDATLLVSEGGGELDGMIGIIGFPHPISGELTVGELFWWTTPEHRGAGVRLLRAAEAWAKAQGAKRMQMIAPTERVGQFYARVGYEAVETVFQRELS